MPFEADKHRQSTGSIRSAGRHWLATPTHRLANELVTPLHGVTGLLGALRHGPGRDAERRRMRYTAERCNEW